MPISMLQLQRMIDLGRVDTSQPVDITAICNTYLFKINTDHRQYGFHLTDEVCPYKASIFFSYNFCMKWKLLFWLKAAFRLG